MTITINKAVKGKEYPPFAVTVERGRIKEFARAIGDLSPFYLDDGVGRASEECSPRHLGRGHLHPRGCLREEADLGPDRGQHTPARIIREAVGRADG